MRSASFGVLFVGAAVAQSVITVINPLEPTATITYKGADDKATTYEKICPSPPSNSTTSGFSQGKETATPTPSPSPESATNSPSRTSNDIELTPISSPAATTAAARLRRQESSQTCIDYTLIQGAETWNFHATDPLTEGAFTYTGDCKWAGELKTADITCTVGVEGKDRSTDATTSTTTGKSTDLDSATAFAQATVVNAPSTPKSGFAASGPLPTGAVAFVGGAAGLYAAVLAL